MFKYILTLDKHIDKLTFMLNEHIMKSEKARLINK